MAIKQHTESSGTSDLRRVTKNTFIYSVGNVATKIVSFLLIPLYTHYLSVYEVGILILLELFERYYASVASLGINSAIWRFFYTAREQSKEKVFVATNYFFLKGTNLVILILLLMTAPISAKHVLSDESFTRLLQFFFVAQFLNLSGMFMRNMLRVYEKAFHFIVLALLDVLMLLSLTIWFVLGLDLGLWGVVYAKLITSSLLFVVTLFYILKQFGLRYRHRELQASLRYGLPLVFHGISLLVLATSDRFFIQHMISTEVVGVYGTGYKFGMIMSILLVTPFIQAWQPILFRLENAPNQKEIYKQFALHYVQVATFAWLVISVMSKYLIMWTTTDAYYAGMIIVPWVAFAYLLYGLQNIFKAGALLNNATARLTGSAILAAVVNIVLNFLMIPKLGMLGAAVATVLSYLLLLSLVLLLSQKFLFINWRWSKIISVIGLGIAVYALSFIDVSNSVMEFLRDVLITIVFMALMVLTKLISPKEVKRFLFSFQKG